MDVGSIRRRSIVIVGVTILVCGLTGAADLLPKQQLGKQLFFDNISSPPQWMSCSSCHAPAVGFTGPVAGINEHGAVYRGAVPTRFGGRKPPSAAYATQSPNFYYDDEEEIFIGGNFWDGRATGHDLGNPAADQARGPFLNPVEQNNPSKQAVCLHVAAANYAGLFEQVWGAGSLDCSDDGVALTYDRIALSIAEYEASPEVSAFSSKFDLWLDGQVSLTPQEMLGMELFDGRAGCNGCHVSETGPDGQKPLFTDYTFDNLGVPRNPENPFYEEDEVYLDDGSPINPLGHDWVDEGLGGFLASQPEWADMAGDNLGKHKVPTLRNVDKRYGRGFPKAFGHNGYFKTLKGIVHFYNTRDVKPVCPDPFTLEKDALANDCWPEAEVPYNVNRDELGNLGLTDEEEDALVVFMATLSDGYRVRGRGDFGSDSSGERSTEVIDLLRSNRRVVVPGR